MKLILATATFAVSVTSFTQPNLPTFTTRRAIFSPLKMSETSDDEEGVMNRFSR